MPQQKETKTIVTRKTNTLRFKRDGKWWVRTKRSTKRRTVPVGTALPTDGGNRVIRTVSRVVTRTASGKKITRTNRSTNVVAK
jgi:hypothetical protein